MRSHGDGSALAFIPRRSTSKAVTLQAPSTESDAEPAVLAGAPSGAIAAIEEAKTLPTSTPFAVHRSQRGTRSWNAGRSTRGTESFVTNTAHSRRASYRRS